MPDTAADGKAFTSLDLAADHVAVPAILRDGVPHAPPPPDWVVAAGDTIVLVGAHEDLTRAVARLEARTTDQPEGGEAGGASLPR